MQEKEKSTHLGIANATVIDVHAGKREIMDILIVGERISEIGPQGTLKFPPQAHVIDAAGQFAIPGLWDAHVHMAHWMDYTDRMSALFVANGVTSVRDFGGKLEDILSIRRNNSRVNVVAPRMWIAGPVIDGSPQVLVAGKSRPAMSVEVDTPEDATNLVDTLVEQGIDFIKPYEMLLPEVFEALMQRARHHHIPAAGHVPMRMSIQEVLDIGQYDIQHLGGSCGGITYDCVFDGHPIPDRVGMLEARVPDETGIELLSKIVKATEITPEDIDPEKIAALIQLCVERGAWHTPTLIINVGMRDLGFLDDPFVKDTVHFLPKHAQAEAWGILESHPGEPVSNGKALLSLWTIEMVAQMNKAGVKLIAGTDTPAYVPGFSIHLELKAMVLAGLSPLEALRTATIRPAEFFNITEDLGSIEIGKIADIVLLEKDPLIDIDNLRTISSVLTRGQIYDRNALDKMLESAIER